MFKKIPHTYVIVFSIILVAAILTWFVPGGAFNRETISVNGIEREVVQPGSFHYVENSPQTWQVFSALFRGFTKSSDIIIFILMIGGSFWILNESKAIDMGIYSFLKFTKRTEKYGLIRRLGVNNIVITLIMLLFSFFGAVFGMSEETIAFVIIFVPLAVSMGYDSIIGVCMCFIGAGIGFAGCLFNPFTLGIAQGIAKLPLYSGIEYRLIVWLIITFVGIALVLRYARKIHKNPKLSPVHEDDEYWRKRESAGAQETAMKTPRAAWIVYFVLLAVFIYYSITQPLTTIQVAGASSTLPVLPVLSGIYALLGLITLRKSAQYFVLTLLLVTTILLIVGVMGFGWYVMEIATLFLVMGIAAGFSMGRTPSKIAKLFLEGSKDILSAAMVVGLAGGIIVILNEGHIVDTLLNSAANSMKDFGKVGTLSFMYGFQTLLNMIITSGSAKAALTMPIMSEFSDLIGLSRQATVTAYQIGDGFTNLITPTSGVLIGVLEVARIKYSIWFKWALPFIIIMVLLGWLLLIPTVTMDLNGF